MPFTQLLFPQDLSYSILICSLNFVCFFSQLNPDWQLSYVQGPLFCFCFYFIPVVLLFLRLRLQVLRVCLAFHLLFACFYYSFLQ